MLRTEKYLMSVSEDLHNAKWKTNPENFIVIKSERVNSEGKHRPSYLIVVYSNGRWVNCIIESYEINTRLALEIIADGVRVVTHEEARRIIAPHRYKDSNNE